jgi:poly-gamma-glutamate synthesis protein (capsule biosynthesis protein)
VIGKLAIDDGADLGIGNHPHAVQGIEVYKGKLITYSHGNFVFDQMWTPDPGQEDPRNGVVGKYIFVDGKLATVGYRPVRIFDYGQPRFLTGAEADAVMARMRLSTQQIATLR